MSLFNNKSPKRLKNTAPLVKFDRDGNIIKEKKETAGNSDSDGSMGEKERMLQKKIEELAEQVEAQWEKGGKADDRKAEEKAPKDDPYNEAVPYDFPGDIIASIKTQISKFFDLSGEKATNAEGGKPGDGGKKNKRRIKINRSTKFGKVLGAVLDAFYEKKEKYMALPKRMKVLSVILTAVLMLALITATFLAWTSGFSDTEAAVKATSEEQEALAKILDEKYSEKRSQNLKPLPYKVTKKELDVRAGAAILVDASNGCILYEKNADKVIPPASITKLFVMYIVYQEIDKGNFTMDDEVPLPEMSWAVNQPRDASLMHLGQGQKVTLRELMEGLAVASGNDASKAIAYYISGSPDKFVERMNEECKKLGLAKTRFVEPSGYDEHNTTTARELATFARIYITKYPECLADFHSLKYIDYPKKDNLPSWQKHLGDSLAIHQVNTNPLLGLMDGVDGIKTGFIYESGYNLALTAKRDDQRFLSITLQGQGHGTREGNAGRIHDGSVMMEWAFDTFADYLPEGKHELRFPIPALAVKENKGRFVNLVPAWTNAIPVPHIMGNTAKDSAAAVTYSVQLPNYTYGDVRQGDTYGYITYKIGDITLEKVPLVSDRSLKKGSAWDRFWGTLAKIKLAGNGTQADGTGSN